MYGPWMQAADGFVLCSHWEGLPMALLEAAACALPAVATDVPGTREAVVHRQTGLLAAAGNEQALQEAMSQIMSMPPEQLRAMGRTGAAARHRRVQPLFGPGQMGEPLRGHCSRRIPSRAAGDGRSERSNQMRCRNRFRAREARKRHNTIFALKSSMIPSLCGLNSLRTRSTEVNSAACLTEEDAQLLNLAVAGGVAMDADGP